MRVTPITIFNHWLDQESALTKVDIPTACCLSTIGTDQYPNARFVSLKEILGNSFIVTGSLKSRKAIEIDLINKVALTFWWTQTGKQVRIQGNATKIDNVLADKYFAGRNRDSQIVSIVSNQGQSLKDIEALNRKYNEIEAKYSNKALTRPDSWGGYSISAIRIEFLEFKATRFHERNLYELNNGQWTHTLLQP